MSTYAYRRAWVKRNQKRVLEYGQKWRRNNLEKARQVSRDCKKRTRDREKRECFLAYGGRCVCCGEKEFRFLTIDHKDGKGARQRRRLKLQGLTGMFMYKWLREQGYPKRNYRLLCYNCNCGRHWNGGVCPHKEKRHAASR